MKQETGQTCHSRAAFPWLTLLLALGFLHDGISLIRRPNLSEDNVRQIVAAQRLIAGRGLTVTNFVPAQPPRLYSHRLRYWPPGYSLIVAASLSLFRDPILTATLLDLLSALLFYASWGWILLWGRSRVVEDRALAFVLTVWAVGISPMTILSSSERLALACFSLSLAATLSLLHRPENGRLRIALASLGITAAIWIRFAYWPLAVVSPWLVVRGAPGPRVRTAIWIGLPALITAIGLWTWMGGASEKPMTNGELFFSQLTYLYPFPSSLFAGEWWTRTWLPHLPWDPRGIFLILWIPSLLILLPFFSTVLHRPRGRSRFFWEGGALVFCVTLAVLVYFSLFMKPQAVEGEAWSPVRESRYFAPLWVFILCAFSAWAWRRRGTFPLVRRGCALFGLGLAVAWRVQTGQWPVARGSLFSDSTLPEITKSVNQELRAGRQVIWVMTAGKKAEARFAEMGGAIVVPEASFKASPPIAFPGVVVWSN